MFHFKNIFLKIFTLFVVWSLFTNAENNGLKICLKSMESTFKINTKPINCVKYAIKTMKLYGESRILYDPHVVMYYQPLYMQLNAEKILLPEGFCPTVTKLNSNNYYYCLSVTKEFENTNWGNEDILENFSEEELNLLTETLNRSKSKTSTGTNTNIASSSDAPLNRKIGDPPPGVVLTNELKNYFHQDRSYGKEYLKHISEYVEIDESIAVLHNPGKFCRTLYLG